jgi:hypothetical protein
MSATPSAPTYLEPLRDIDAILARIDALFACLGDVSEEKQWLYVATETQHCRDPAAIAAIADRSERKAAIDYNAAVQASIDANSLAPAAMQALAAQIQSCHKYYKDFHDASWDQNGTYALNFCEKMIEVLTMLEAQGRYEAFLADVKSGKAQPISTVDAVITSSLLFWYSPQNKHGPNYNPNPTKPAPAPPTVTQQLASLKMLYEP